MQYASAPDQNMTWIPVSGVQGAREHIVQPGRTAWLMDNNAPIFYVKAADALGVTTLKAFKFAEISLEQTGQTGTESPQNTLKAEISDIRSKLEELTIKVEKWLKTENKGVIDDGQ